MPTNLVVFIHGTTPHPRLAGPVGQYPQLYKRFWSALTRVEPSLEGESFSRFAHIEWGHPVAGAPQREDSMLAEAERRIAESVAFERVKASPSEHNQLHGGILGDWSWLPGLRPVVRRIREQLVTFGLADAVYYASEEGERAVRTAVYGQVLEKLRPLRALRDVRLHVIAHSLGVTVSHDFLYGLFGKAGEPDFLAQTNRPEDRADYDLWRTKARSGELRVGSFVSMASQLPLFALRKSALVRQLSEGATLDPALIGIAPDGPVRWLVAYDSDDVLGFATRELYGNPASIRQMQIDAGDTPLAGHDGYWEEPCFIEEAARVIASGGQ
jgi:hypothetical protein